MGYRAPDTYTIQARQVNISPLDSSTYYIGAYDALSGSNVLGRLYILRTGTIRGVTIHWSNTTVNCSAENTQICVRKNDATDSSDVYLGSFANASSPITNHDVSFPVTEGDYVFIKMVTPAWVTNPTGVYLWATLRVDCD